MAAAMADEPVVPSPSLDAGVRPLAEILEQVMPAIDGEVSATRIRKEADRWVYVIVFSDENGRNREMQVDAGTGEILGMRFLP